MFDFIRFHYSDNLHWYLNGVNLVDPTQTYPQHYFVVLLVIIVLTFLAALNFYLGLFNDPRFRWKTWLLHLLALDLVVFLAAYFPPYSAMVQGKVDSAQAFSSFDVTLFGITAIVYNTLYFVGLSAVLKRFSVNNRKVPF